MVPQSQKSRKRIGYIKILLMTGLTILGVLGNLVSVSLLYDAALVFGSIATFLIIYFFGPWAGFLTAPVISLSTFLLWGHPFGIIMFTAEAAFVGFIYYRRRSSYILLDILYHVLLGIPLVFSISFFILDKSPDWAMLFALTRAFNGVVNVFLAITIVDILQYLRHSIEQRNGGEKKKRKIFSFILSNLNIRGSISFRKALNDFFGVVILIPVLLIIIYISRLEIRRVEEDANDRLNTLVGSVILSLEEWIEETVAGVSSFTSIAGETGIRTPRGSNFLTLLLQSKFDFKGAGVVDDKGRIISHRFKEEYPDLKTGKLFPLSDTLFPFSSNEPGVIDFKDSSGKTCIVIIMPYTNQYLFVIIGSGNVRRLLYDYVRGSRMDLILTGRYDQIIASTTKIRDTEFFSDSFDDIEENGGAWERDILDDELSVSESLEGFFKISGGINVYGWKVTGLFHLGEQKKMLVDTIIRILLFVFLLTVIITSVSEVASKLLVSSVERLNSVTDGLHKKIEEGISIEWPKSFLYEVSSLIKNFQFTVGLIRGHVKNLSAANTKYKKAMVEAETANAAKSQFLATVSHELKTPLNGILGYVQILRKEGCSETQQHGLEIIEKSGNHLLTIINDILDVSRIETNKVKIEKREFSLSKFLSEMSGIAKILADQHGIGLRTEFDPNLPETVLGDEGRIRQVLLNLIQNAVKFTGEGFIQLRVVRKNGIVRFEVTDTGTGIPQDKLDSIFNPFIQLDNNGVASQGTGLGLTIVKKFLNLMDSDIYVNSREGEGSTFWFEMDLTSGIAGEDKMSDIDIIQEQTAFPNLHLNRIIIDDDGHIPERDTLEAIFQSARKGDIKGVLKQATKLSADNADYQKFTSKIRGLAGSFRIKELVEYLRDLLSRTE